MLQKVFRGIRHLSPEKAVAVEKASGGAYRFEDLVRPEVTQAFHELAEMRKAQKCANCDGGGCHG